jgi:hypothetical protein
MTGSLRLTAWPWLAVLAVVVFTPPSSRGVETPGSKQFHKDIQPLLNQYCSDCHEDGEKKGGVAFDQFPSDEAMLTNHDLWLNVIKYVRAGIMPPAKKPRPAAQEQERLAEWVKSAVFKTDPQNPDPGRVTIRRLNRVEYRNTIRDLMGIDFNAEVEFPPDDTGYGFDDIGDVLTLSPMLLEKYLAAARSIVAEAVPTVSKTMPEMTIAGAEFRKDGEPESKRRDKRDSALFLPYDKEAAVSTPMQIERSGHYRLTLELGIRGTFDYDPRRCSVVFKLDDRNLWENEFGWYDNKTLLFNFDQELQAGPHRLSFTLHPLTNAETNTLTMRLASVTVHGPTEQQFWTRPSNYGRFFAGEIPRQPAARRKYTQETLRKFASKAFRRPVDDSTVERLTKLAESVYTQEGQTVEAGIAHAMQAVLASPRFLFHLEQPEPGTDKDGAYPLVDEYSLASRLSYFLWSTMPDEEMFRLAGRKELRKNLTAQVKRMTADSRSEALVQNFTGQWLQVRDLQGIAINARVVFARDAGLEKQMRQRRDAFVARQAQQKKDREEALKAGKPPPEPRKDEGERERFRFRPPFELDRELKQAMKSETEMFFADVVKEDRPVSELIESDFTYLNAKLADFYGLTNLNVTGSEMRRVSLPADCPRGGILTMGSILAVTSNPDRTSPVKRGVFVLNNILGTPPPPPPPNVPALEATEKNAEDKEPTLRTALEAHRKEPLCASCHVRMDGIGLGLENFNAMGLWREKERGQMIDPSGKLVTGETFNDVRELKKILAEKHGGDFERCLTEKLLTYALGRGLEYYDLETVDQIVRRLEKEDGHFSALLMGIIESAPFQKERPNANATFSDTTDGSDGQVQLAGTAGRNPGRVQP